MSKKITKLEQNENESGSDTERKAKKPRLSEGDIRNGRLVEGAILLEFTPHKDAPQEIIVWWRQTEKYGFFVSVDGCMIPYKQYWGSKGSRPAARGLVTQFFYNERTSKKPINDEGWPCNEQYSHKCHVSNCVSPKCIIIEEQWKNLKRNYCGINGKCDCGNTIKCTRKFHNEQWDWKFDYMSYDTKELSSKLANLFPDTVKFKVLPRNFYSKKDVKAQNRSTRKKRRKKK